MALRFAIASDAACHEGGRAQTRRLAFLLTNSPIHSIFASCEFLAREETLSFGYWNGPSRVPHSPCVECLHQITHVESCVDSTARPCADYLRDVYRCSSGNPSFPADVLDPRGEDGAPGRALLCLFDCRPDELRLFPSTRRSPVCGFPLCPARTILSK